MTTVILVFILVYIVFGVLPTVIGQAYRDAKQKQAASRSGIRPRQYQKQ